MNLLKKEKMFDYMKNLNELESSVSESLEASRSTIRQWQRETRELVRRLGDLRLVNA